MQRAGFLADQRQRDSSGSWPDLVTGKLPRNEEIDLWAWMEAWGSHYEIRRSVEVYRHDAPRERLGMTYAPRSATFSSQNFITTS
jgi:hypothetical protein